MSIPKKLFLRRQFPASGEAAQVESGDVEQASQPACRAARKHGSQGRGMEFHPDPAEEGEEMRPLHLVLRNVLRGRGAVEEGQRRGGCLEAYVSILSCSLPVFLEIKDGQGGPGFTSS